MLAKVVNDDAALLVYRSALAFFASKLAPTGFLLSMTACLSVQRVQPLGAGDAVQHVRAQRVTGCDVRVFKICLRIVMHTDGLHDFL